ncbi:MAG: hypothetical protein JO092_07740, partial [Candidatus Eremiobacteraeota bacterium]|nr:hypothetical protein [Candidatus Eremiobacteraeota bacterium]
MTRDLAKSRLDAASQWLDGAGSTHPGAAAAKRAIASFLGSFASGALNAPQDDAELTRMIVTEGRLYLPRTTSKRQAREFEDAVSSAIVAARKGLPQGDTL